MLDFHAFLDRIFRKSKSQNANRKNRDWSAVRKRRRPVRLAIEQLEDRSLPSVAIAPSLDFHDPGPHQSGSTTTNDATSANWSGYAAATSFSNPTNGSVSAVGGTWVEPHLSSSSPNNGISSTWVGIDGVNDSTVEQIGTTQQWVNGTQQDYAWVEFYGDESAQGVKGPYYYPVPISGFNVSPGDTISASVSFVSNNSNGTSTFAFAMNDVTQNESDSFQLTTTYVQPQRSSAEWIVEQPKTLPTQYPLANFGTVTFSGAWATINGTTGPINNSTWQSTPIIMQQSGVGYLSSPSPLTDSSSQGFNEPSGGSGSSSFRVNYGTWNLTHSAGPFVQISAGKDAEGRPVVFGLGTDERVYYEYQNSDGTWSSWQGVSGQWQFLQLAVGKDYYGNMAVYALGTDHRIYYIEGSPGNWTLNLTLNMGPFEQVTLIGEATSWYHAVFGLGNDGNVYEVFQDAQGWHWEGVTNDGKAVQITAGLDAYGRPAVFATQSDGQVYEAWQDSQGKWNSWSSTTTSGAPPVTVQQIVEGRDASNDTVIYVLGTNGQVWEETQYYNFGTWDTSWTLVATAPPTGAVTNITFGYDAFGDLVLYGILPDGQVYDYVV